VTYPRVLHVGFEPIGTPTNSGLTLRSMFADWPAEKLLQICLRGHPRADGPGTLVIAPASVAPIDGAARWILGSHVPSGAVDGMNNSIDRERSLPLNQRLRILATTVNDIGPVRLPRSVVLAAESFRPQVIHSLLGGVRAMKLASGLSEKLGVPLVPHFMDDWADNLFAQGQLGGYARRVAERELARVWTRAPVCLTIGEQMSAEFAQRFGLPCFVVGNSVDFDEFAALAGRQSVPVGAELVMRYVGGLHLGRDMVIESVAKRLAGRQYEGRPWCLELHVPAVDSDIARRLSQQPNVRFGGSLTPSEVPQALVSADALLFIESAAPGVAKFTRLSVSTKVPQYLAARRPIMVIGPAEQASVGALLRAETGIYAGSAESGMVEQAITGIESTLAAAAPRRREIEAWMNQAFARLQTQERLRRAMVQAAGPGTHA